MREIKFRAWNRETNKMWWFNPLWGNCYNQGAGYIGMLPIGKQMEHIGGFTGHDNRVMIDPDDCELMQYTGLKDKNGKEIYEGDIYFQEVWMFGNNEGWHKGVVEYNPASFVIRFAWGTSVIRLTGEVIGNIYENSELMEV